MKLFLKIYFITFTLILFSCVRSESSNNVSSIQVDENRRYLTEIMSSAPFDENEVRLVEIAEFPPLNENERFAYSLQNIQTTENNQNHYWQKMTMYAVRNNNTSDIVELFTWGKGITRLFYTIYR